MTSPIYSDMLHCHGACMCTHNHKAQLGIDKEQNNYVNVTPGTKTGSDGYENIKLITKSCAHSTN